MGPGPAIGADETINPTYVALIDERIGQSSRISKRVASTAMRSCPPDGADAQTRLPALFGRVA